MANLYRQVLRSLGSLQRPPPRSAWNPSPQKNPSSLNPKAFQYLSTALRNSFESPRASSTENAPPAHVKVDQALQFIDSLKGTSDSAQSGRIALLNATRLMAPRSRRPNPRNTKTNIGGQVHTLLSSQLRLFQPTLCQCYTTHTTPPRSRGQRYFSSSSSPPPSTSPSQFSKDARANKPYESFGNHPTQDDAATNDDDYEWVDEVWELRRYDATGREYIYNRTTHEIRPAEEAYDSANATLVLDYTPLTVSVKRRDVDEMEDRELRWEEHAEVRGDRFPYYLNRATGDTTWQFPFEDPSLVPEVPVIHTYQFMKISNIDELPYAPLPKRLGAAAIDFAVTMSATSVYSGVMYYEMGAKCLPGVAILMFVAYSWRDALLDNGSLGVGKKYMGLEIIKSSDGTLPSRYETVGRSCYFISYYGLLAVGVFEMPELIYAAGGLLSVDAGLMFLKGKRIGDYLFKTKVVETQELREERIQDRKDYLAAETAAA